jgi:LysM repeat protein
MAYVQPRGAAHDLPAAALRHGTRFVAIGGYAVAVAVAFVLLSPLPSRGSGAVGVVPTGPQPVLYTVRPGDTPSGIAASQGISLSQLFALNPDLTPLKDPGGAPVVVGLR